MMAPSLPTPESVARVERAIGRAQYRAAMRLLARVARVREEHATLDGVRVPFFARGELTSKATPLLLVHGFGADKEGWLFLAMMLDRRRAVLAPDLPGFGAAGSIPSPHASARRQADALARLLDHLGVERAHLVGSSMGGGISLRLAADRPERVASMTLIGSVGPVVDKSEVILAIERGENPLITDSPSDLARLLALVTERVPPMTRPMRRHLGHERFLRRDALLSLFAGWSSAQGGDGVPVDLASIATPALVIHGDRDRVIHPSTGRALAERLKNARLELMRGIGHIPAVEAPRAVAKMIEAFVC